MHTQTFTHQPASGWSTAPFPPGTGARTLVLAFGAPELFDDPGALDALVRAYPGAAIAGCSTAGEIAGVRILDNSLSVAVACFEHTDLRVVTARAADLSRSFAAGEELGRGLESRDLRAVFVLSDGLSVNGSELLRGLHAALPPEVVITGGLAGDGSRFVRTWVLADGRPTERTVVAVGFYGDAIRVGHGSRGGWDIFGPERRVTRSSGSVLYELDGQPALELYKSYLGDRAAGLPATALLFPLSLRASAKDAKTLVRTVLAVDEAAQSMTFAGDVPEGSLVQLMRANFDRLVEGASEAGRRAGGYDTSDSLAVAISCVGRRLVLGERTEEEVEATASALPASASLVGFYSYGEISPYAAGECGALHNQTMTVTTLWEH